MPECTRFPSLGMRERMLLGISSSPAICGFAPQWAVPAMHSYAHFWTLTRKKNTSFPSQHFFGSWNSYYRRWIFNFLKLQLNQSGCHVRFRILDLIFPSSMLVSYPRFQTCPLHELSRPLVAMSLELYARDWGQLSQYSPTFKLSFCQIIHIYLQVTPTKTPWISHSIPQKLPEYPIKMPWKSHQTSNSK